jgi:flagellar basal-body rod protein FlgC
VSLFGGLNISASALTAERLRMNVIAENIANAETTRSATGGPYRRQQVALAELPGEALPGFPDAGGGVQALGVQEDTSPPRMVFDPSHPDANGEGYVQMPNVDVPAEVVDLMAATRAYEANALAFQTQRQSQERALELLA